MKLHVFRDRKDDPDKRLEAQHVIDIHREDACEPGIEDKSYEQILRFIRHQGRTFESTPAAFAVHGEEDLRDIAPAQPNGGFQGEATGEPFRKSGKTDIRFEQDDQAALLGNPYCGMVPVV